MTPPNKRCRQQPPPWAVERLLKVWMSSFHFRVLLRRLCLSLVVVVDMAMKITLGGKISITLALLCAGFWAMLLLVPGDAAVAQEFGYVALAILSYPIAQFSGMFSHTDSGPPSELYMYLLLTIPNSFFLGYSISGGFYLLRRVCRSTHRKA